jgi:GLPGLI family protein
MKRIFIITFLVLCSNLIFSQGENILVEYKSTRNNISNSATLIANAQNALYMIDSLLIEKEDKTKLITIDEDKNKINIAQRTVKIDASVYYLERTANIIYFTKKFNKTNTLIKDELPALNWNIEGTETKKIGNFICKKATLNFRGSEIEAWYSEEINIPFGPWKFKGLPGLILELYNVNDPVVERWEAIKIIFPYTKNVDFSFRNGLKVALYKDVVKNREIEINEQINRMQTRVPQGVTAKKSTLNRLSIEKKFEWED